MARPQKRGVDYFPLDVDIVNDRKIRKIMRECKAKGFTILIHLLCQIYRENGYCILWNDELTFDIAEAIGNGFEENEVRDLICKAVDVGFFKLLEINEGEKILTSEGIQQRYKQITEKRSIDYSSLPYWILPVKTLSPPKTELPTPETELPTPESTQRKGKEIKVNESREEKRKEIDDSPDTTHFFYPKYKGFIEQINTRYPIILEMKEPITWMSFGRIYDRMCKDCKDEKRRHALMKEVLQEMANKPDLLNKYASFEFTFNSFMKNKKGLIPNPNSKLLLNSDGTITST